MGNGKNWDSNSNQEGGERKEEGGKIRVSILKIHKELNYELSMKNILNTQRSEL